MGVSMVAAASAASPRFCGELDAGAGRTDSVETKQAVRGSMGPWVRGFDGGAY
jgi:hypothetical protein